MTNTMLAAQMYTLREYTQSYDGIDQAFAKVKAMGYQAAQMSGWSGVTPQQLKELADKHGLILCATHVSFDDIVSRTEETIANHKLWGTHYVGLGAMPAEFRGSREGALAFCKAIAPAAKKIADAGLMTIYHNHHFEFTRCGDRTVLDILMENTDPDSFQFEVDTYWVTAGGGDPIDWIRKMKGRMDVVHFKDMVYDPAANGSVFAEIGQGNLNWTGILSACGEIGVKWHIVEQDVCKGSPFDSLATSYRYLQKLGLR